MRCRPLRWLWGVLPIVAWAFIVVLGEQRSVEADLTQRAQAALGDAGLSWADTSFSGRDAVLAGKAAEDADPGRAAQILTNMWGVRVVENRAGLIETADAYVWGANIRENRVRLTGFVPNDETRRTIYGVAQATFPNREIQDQSKLARGAPPRDAWLGGVSFALKQLAHLRRGSVDLDRTALTIEGEAVDGKGYTALKTALASSLPSGVTLKDDKVRPPVVSPFTWSLSWDGKQVGLSGYAPGEKIREGIAADIRKAFPRASLADRTDIAAGEPKDFAKIIAAILPAISSMVDATVEIKDAVLSLSGTAATDVAAEAIRDRLKAALAGTAFRIADQLKYREAVPKAVSPFVTSLEISGSTAAISGYVPAEAQRTQLLDAIRSKFPNLRINDQMAVAAGAPDGWLACLEAGLGSLSRIKSGGLQLSDRALVLSGGIEDEDLHAALPAELKAAANRACDTDFKVALNVPPEPNLAWRAVRGPSDVVLEGFAPSAEAKAELVKLAASLFPNTQVIDRMTISPATTRKWIKVAEAGLRALSRLRIGEANIAEQTLTVTGEASDAARAAAVKDGLARTLPRGYVGRETVALRSEAMIWAEQEAKRKAEEDAKRKADDEAKRRADEEAKRRSEDVATKRRLDDEAKRKSDADEARRKAEAEEARRKADAEALARATPQQKAAADRCTTLLASAARAGTITFDFASAELQRESFGTLDKLVDIAKTCPDSRIEIAGHTDAVGNADINEALSIKRAEAVVAYLVSKGVEASRLTATGYGEARPLVANTSADKRAMNRRIEFMAKPR